MDAFGPKAALQSDTFAGSLMALISMREPEIDKPLAKGRLTNCSCFPLRKK